MEWIEIEEDLPFENAMVYAELPRKKIVWCIYQNDSFGLGDNDFDVIRWQYAMLPDLKHQNCNLRSTLQAEDHKDVYSSELRLNLV